MDWTKKGLIFEPKKQFDWVITHAQLPFAENIEEDIYRIYFSGRDRLNRSQIGYIEINVNEPQKILYITEKPILGLGEVGCFDDSGVTPSWIVDYEDKKYMYYIGWNPGVTIQFYLFVGLAISENRGKTFERFSKAPILARNSYDPYVTTAPCVIIENGIWRMWYVSGVKCGVVGGKFEKSDKPKPFYNIKYAESTDGINWERRGVVCIDFKSKDEYALARPCVIKEDGIYKMWYSYKGESYRIGYAESEDGITWERKDAEVGIDVSESGWDSEMIEYAFVFKHKGKKYMLYNGDDHGKTGFGYAVMDENN